MNTKQKHDFRSPLKRILGHFYNLIGIILFLLGAMLRLLSIGKEGFVWTALGDFGSFLAVAVAVPFIYDRLIKSEERELFLADLEEVIKTNMQDICSQKSTPKFYDSRRSLEEKIAFMETAKSEVVELGIALRTFASYFEQRPSKDFKDHILGLLQRGVVFKCIAMDPDCEIAANYARDRGEEELIDRIRNSLKNLKALQDEFIQLGVPGKFEIYLYSHIPYFHALCIDGDKENGSIFISPYIYGTKRAELPGFEFSKNEYPIMFEKYWKSIKKLFVESRKL